MVVVPTVRVAVPEDAEAAVDVLRRSITVLCSADHGGDPETLEEWLEDKTVTKLLAWMERPGQYTVVAELEGTLCGVGLLGSDGEVRLCYVHPEHVRRGVGRALLDAMETRARERGQVRLRLDATCTAIRFYEAMGYHRFGPSDRGYGLARCHPYEKLLTAAC